MTIKNNQATITDNEEANGDLIVATTDDAVTVAQGTDLITLSRTQAEELSIWLKSYAVQSIPPEA